MEKINLESKDLINDNIEKIETLFPNAVKEVMENEKITKKIDFDTLKQQLTKEIIEDNDKERYQMTWPGKREVEILANTPTTKTLRPVKDDSVDWENTENIYIEGDNLEVLKLLQESYLGKIKCIYIDPPYNTGKDFIYKDNFTQEKEEYLEDSGQVDEEGNRLFQNNESNGRYHSDWLSMMYPRLKLARNLLSDDGVIFISIDDNEVHNLRKICDEVFGEGDFVSNIIWERAFSPKNDAKYFSVNHDNILIYSKNISDFSIGKLERTEEANSRYKNPDNDPRGLWTSGDLSVKTYSVKTDYPIQTPSGKTVNPPKGTCWRVSKEKFDELNQDNRIWFGKTGANVPRLKRFLSEVQNEMVPTSIWTNKEVGHNQEGRQELKKIFSGNAFFDGLKPVKLLLRILKTANLDDDSIILDFFSGSATTAHAVLKQNAEDEGNRKYIMVQLPEETSEKSEAFKSGYKNICEIGKERIRRAAKQIKEETTADIDYGFRVYRLDSSSINEIHKTPDEVTQKSLAFDMSTVKEDRTDEDLLIHVILSLGLKLSLNIKEEIIEDKKIFNVAKNSLITCFADNIPESLIETIAKREPLKVVFRDNSFKNDDERINLEEIFKMFSPNTDIKVL